MTTTEAPLLVAFHGDPALKETTLADLREHYDTDRIVQGAYWERDYEHGGGFRGCAVGCLTHDPNGGHDQYPERWGLSIWLAHLEDRIFEGLSADVAREWPLRLMAAIPVGYSDWDELRDRLAVRRLRETVLPLAASWPKSVQPTVVNVIWQVVDALEGRGDLDAAVARSAEAAARSAEAAAAVAQSVRAARSAEAAAWAARAARAARSAEAAAWSVWTRSARAARAARSAEAAAWAARPAEAAAWAAEADRLIEELTR